MVTTMNSKHLKLFELFVLLITSLSCITCGNEPVVPEVKVEEGKTDYFSESMDFPSTGGIKILHFTSNVKWNLKVSETQGSSSWCTVSQGEGEAGSFGVAVMVEENTGDNDRNVVLVFEAGTIHRSVIVNQKQKNSITITTNRFEVDNTGGIIDVEVKSNVNYDVEIPELYRNWISQVPSTRSASTQMLSFKIKESTEYDKREGEIIISSKDLSEKIKVYQSGSSILILSQNEYTLGSEGDTISIDISSNFEFETDMPDVDWIKPADGTRALSSHTLTYIVKENNTYDDREAVIIFKDVNRDKKESVTIKQRQKDAIILSRKVIEMGQDGGTFSVDVNSNVDYTVTIPSSCSSWINKNSSSTTRSLTTSNGSFVVSSSEELVKREGEIYFKYSNIADTLKVYQSGGSILVLNQNAYSLEGIATTISVQVKSNMDYSVTTSGDWITEVSTRAVSSSTKKFNIATNKTGSSRTGKITFETSDRSKKEDVTITQASIIPAQSLNINLVDFYRTIGGRLYIGEDYGFTVTVSPNNADTDYEWSVVDSGIASISANGNRATLTTKDFGTSKVVVTEKNSGISTSCDFGTCVTNFQFVETSRETRYLLPVIKMAVGDQHQLKYTCTPEYATNVFCDLRAFNFKEVDMGINTYVIVDESSIVDIDKNGLMTAKKVGTTIIDANNGYGVGRISSLNNGVFVEVVEEISPYGTIGGHGYVDLGLPSGKLWATENFGSYSDTSYGPYYLWTNSDRVPTAWGNLWSTPTRQEFNELLDNCTYEWTQKNGVNGYLFSGKRDAKLFLPASGFQIYSEGYGYSNIQSANEWVLYWTITSSNDSWEGQGFAFALNGTSTSITTNTTYNTTIMAAPIRPISR